MFKLEFSLEELKEMERYLCVAHDFLPPSHCMDWVMFRLREAIAQGKKEAA